MGRFGENNSPEICQPQSSWPKFTITAKFNGVQETIVNNTGQQIATNGHSPWIQGKCMNKNKIKELSDLKFNVDRKSFLVKGTQSTCLGQCIVYLIDDKHWRITFDQSNCGVNIDIQAKPFRDINQNIKCIACNCTN